MRFVVLLSALTFSFSIHAQKSLPDPNTCGQQLPAAVTIEHTGQSFIAAIQTYTTTLDFQRPGQFEITTNWGPDHSEIVDGQTLRNSWETGVLAKLALNLNGNYDCGKGKYTKKCAVSLANTLQALKVVEDNMLDRSRNAIGSEALRCARSILVSVMERSFAAQDGLIGRSVEDFHLRSLDDKEASVVFARVEAISEAKKAKDAADTALILSIVSSSSSSSSSSRSR